MLRFLWAFWNIIYLLQGLHFSGTHGLDVIRRQIDLPVTFPVGLPLFRLPSDGYFLWMKNTTTDFYFQINDTQLVLTEMLNNSTENENSRQFEVYKINLNSTKSYLPNYVLRVRVVKNTAGLCSLRSHVCFLPSAKTKYLLPDSLPVGQPFDVLSNSVIRNICQTKPEIKYSILNGSDVVDVDVTSGALSLRQTANPSTDYHQINIGCSVKTDGYEMDFAIDADVRIYDVNNHAPYMRPGKSPIVEIEIGSLKLGTKISEPFNVYDKDSPEVNDLRPHLENDYLGFFSVEIKERTIGRDGILVIISELTVKKEVKFPEKMYEFQMVFEDKNLERHLNNTVVFFIQVHNRTKESLPETGKTFFTELPRSAAKYARVGNVSFSSLLESEMKFSLTPSPGSSSFGITPKTGIVFVKDEKKLKDISENSLQLNVTWVQPHNSSYYIVSVNITDEIEYCSKREYVSSCAVQGVGQKCISSCSEGSQKGRCEWRPSTGNDNLSFKGYATCSPSLRTCPDGECDELEASHKNICPQDCARDITGQVRIGPEGGILAAYGTCRCMYLDTCSCNPPPVASNFSRQRSEPRATETSTNYDYDVQVHKSAAEMCGQNCVLVIVGVFVTLALTVCLLFMVYHFRGRPRRRKAHHFNSHISLSVVPSDYVDERRVSAAGQVISASLLQSALAPDNMGSRKNSVDVKWEFAREKLILEEVIGEGEFGRVVKGRAKGIKDRPGYTIVAVKMLKECSSPSDREDLLSELALLKEVSHPNVIQLLGACTQKDGPLHVIVEFAELGSLRCFLRQSRRLDMDRKAQLGTVENPAYITEAAVLKHRDLLSFAWQTAKGMAYLSDIKVVHRDLAARNILLGSGKVVKISDFGLSRDVYEGDTYLKKSKGRVPVKWMALESLQDHVYTSKSDVWSFGVVLWEIVNLGASPYPGVTPERLYQLLRMGYRMEKTESCPEEVYSVMRQCWRASPSQRPSFKSLSQKLDTLLQDTAEYLDLEVTVTCAHEDTYLQNETSCEEEVFTPLTYSCSFPEETRLEYGNICHLLSGSSGSSVQDI